MENNNDKKKRRRGVAQALYCALGGAIMGLAVVMYAMSQSNIDQTINLQAAENSYITATHVSEEARLFFTKAMDFVIQLAIEDVSSHGGLTSKEPATGMKTTSGGVRYWKWCDVSGLPTSCDNANCNPQSIPGEGLVENTRINMTAAASKYLDDYKLAFEKNETSHAVNIELLNPKFTIYDTKINYSSVLNALVLTRPAGVELDASFRTAGTVESHDTINVSHNVRMSDAVGMAFTEAGNLPTRNTAYTYDCIQSTKTFTRKCPDETSKTCSHVVECCSTDADGVETCEDCIEDYDCSDCDPVNWQVKDSATVTDYDCLITFTVPDSKMVYTLTPGEIKMKDQTFKFAASYRTWSGTCNTGSPPGTGECGNCKYETS